MNSTQWASIDLKRRIESRIEWDKRVSLWDLSILVEGTKVTLDGYFDSTERQLAALEVVKSTAGVTELVNNSQVLDGYRRPDKEIERLIEIQIESLGLHSNERIDVAVDDGVVTLEGIVFRSKLKAFAAGAAWELCWVRDCINMIAVMDSPPNVEARPLIPAHVVAEPAICSH